MTAEQKWDELVERMDEVIASGEVVSRADARDLGQAAPSASGRRGVSGQHRNHVEPAAPRRDGRNRQRRA